MKQTGQSDYRIIKYENNNGLESHLFQVVLDGIVVYEQDYGSQTGTIYTYLKDYAECLLKEEILEKLEEVRPDIYQWHKDNDSDADTLLDELNELGYGKYKIHLLNKYRYHGKAHGSI